MYDDDARVGQLREVAADQGYWLRRDHPRANSFWLVDRARNTPAHMPPGTGIPLDEIERRLTERG